MRIDPPSPSLRRSKQFFSELKRRSDPRFETLGEKMFTPLKHLGLCDD
jgi:hypothetical protein